MSVEELQAELDKAMAAMDYGADDSRWVPGETALDALIRERDELRAENERLRGLTPELPPRAPEGEGLPRYGLRWNGPDQPVAVPMPDGYWTPWYLADKALKELEGRWDAEVGHANRHWKNAREATAENTKLRAILARSKEPCLYCGLTEMSKCERGFPGCGRMDDIMADEFADDPEEEKGTV